jgi:hypothetical protein
MLNRYRVKSSIEGSNPSLRHLESNKLLTGFQSEIDAPFLADLVSDRCPIGTDRPSPLHSSGPELAVNEIDSKRQSSIGGFESLLSAIQSSPQDRKLLNLGLAQIPSKGSCRDESELQVEDPRGVLRFSHWLRAGHY